MTNDLYKSFNEFVPKVIALPPGKLKGDYKLSPKNGGKLYDINTAAALNGCTSFRMGCSNREERMTYRERLHPWCIIRHLPNLQRLDVARLRRRKDAEDHLRVLQQITPNVSYSIVFDLKLDSAEATANKQPTGSASPVL